VGGWARTRGFWDQSGPGANLDQLGRLQRGRGLDFERQLFDHQRPREHSWGGLAERQRANWRCCSSSARPRRPCPLDPGPSTSTSEN
jgi:hypothetical protein